MVLAVLIVTFLAGMAGWRLLIDAIHRRVVQRLALEPGLSVADIGCGPGRLAARIGRAVGPRGQVVGIDVNEKALRAAERRATRSGLSNVRFVRAAAGGGGLGEARFDRAVLVAALGEIHDREAALAEILRALKPAGLLLVAEVASDPHRQSVDQVRRLAAAAGFMEQAVGSGQLAGGLGVMMTFRKPSV